MPHEWVLLSTIPVSDDNPSTLTSYINRLKRLWREGERRREQLNEQCRGQEATHG